MYENRVHVAVGAAEPAERQLVQGLGHSLLGRAISTVHSLLSFPAATLKLYAVWNLTSKADGRADHAPPGAPLQALIIVGDILPLGSRTRSKGERRDEAGLDRDDHHLESRD